MVFLFVFVGFSCLVLTFQSDFIPKHHITHIAQGHLWYLVFSMGHHFHFYDKYHSSITFFITSFYFTLADKSLEFFNTDQVCGWCVVVGGWCGVVGGYHDIIA